MWREVVCFNQRAGWLFVRSRSFEIDLDDLRVAVTPLSFDKIDTFLCGEVDHCVRVSSRRVGICFRKCATSEENECAENKRRRKAQAPHGCVDGRLAMRAIELDCPRAHE